MTATRWVSAAILGFLVSPAFGGPPPSLAQALAMPATLPTLTPTEQQAAVQAAAAYQRQHPTVLAPAAPVAPRRTLPTGTWTREIALKLSGPDADKKVGIASTLRVLPEVIQIDIQQSLGDKSAGICVTVDYAVLANGTVVGMVSHIDVAGMLNTPDIFDKQLSEIMSMEGLPFSVTMSTINNQMLIGKPRVAGPILDSIAVFISGTYKPVELPQAAVVPVAPVGAVMPIGAVAQPGAMLVPAALGGVVGQELGGMLGDMVDEPRAGAVAGSAIGAAVGTMLQHRAVDENARTALEVLESVAGWLGVRGTVSPPRSPEVLHYSP